MWLDDWFRERRRTGRTSSSSRHQQESQEDLKERNNVGRVGVPRKWEARRKASGGLWCLLACLCCLFSTFRVAHGAFTGSYKLQGIRSFPAVADLQDHCNKIVVSEEYHIIKKNSQHIEFRPGYDSYASSYDEQPTTLTSSTFVGHFTGYDTFSGNFHGMLLSNCSGQFLNSMSILHCPVPKEESFSGRCIITLECSKGPCTEKGGSIAEPVKTPFDVAAVDFLVWLWKRLFLALVVTSTAFAALGLSFFFVNSALQYSRAKRGQAKINLLDWLTTGDLTPPTPKSPYRRSRSASFLLHEAEYLDMALIESNKMGSSHTHTHAGTSTCISSHHTHTHTHTHTVGSLGLGLGSKHQKKGLGLGHKRNKSFASREFAFSASSSDQMSLHRREVHSSGDLTKTVSVPAFSEYV